MKIISDEGNLSKKCAIGIFTYLCLGFALLQTFQKLITFQQYVVSTTL